MGILNWLTKRALKVPERWRKAQPLKKLAGRLGVPQSTRDVLNATLAATELQFYQTAFAHVGEARRETAEQAAIILGNLLREKPFIAQAELADVKERARELERLLRYDFGIALSSADATLREFLIREALRLVLNLVA